MPFVGGSGFPQTGDNRTRSSAVQELASFVGGEDDDKTKQRAGMSWDSAVREFNSVPWKFNRLTYDISLTSTMLDNTTAPSVSRDAGTGTGLVLTTGTRIVYWVEERVKDGSKITKRNLSDAARTITLTGDGTTDKPVITRPSTVNADTTHWALFGTRAGGAFPEGRELDEVEIATTTIEDLRTGNNPAIGTGNPYYVGVYLLETDFRNPKSAHLVDELGHEIGMLEYVPHDAFLRYCAEDASWSTTYPDIYTVRNAHETGELMVMPRQTRPTGYPTLRLVYHRRIALATGDPDKLNVPMEVDEAIFTLATAKFLAKVRTHAEDQTVGTRTAFQLARDARMQVESEHRDWPPLWPS